MEIVNKKKLILASQSPRRKKILSDAGYEFDIVVSDADEDISISDAPLLVKELAMIKACETAKKVQGDCFIIGADTVVCINGRILGKPKNKRHARLMLKLLSGRTHQVYTGVCVADRKSGAAISRCEKSEVGFRKLKNIEIAEYVAGGEPMDKAGAYAIQGGAGKFVSYVKGNFDNIIGLPVNLLENILLEMQE